VQPFRREEEHFREFVIPEDLFGDFYAVARVGGRYLGELERVAFIEVRAHGMPDHLFPGFHQHNPEGREETLRSQLTRTVSLQSPTHGDPLMIRPSISPLSLRPAVPADSNEFFPTIANPIATLSKYPRS
jgi:hypothetical protein